MMMDESEGDANLFKSDLRSNGVELLLTYKQAGVKAHNVAPAPDAFAGVLSNIACSKASLVLEGGGTQRIEVGSSSSRILGCILVGPPSNPTHGMAGMVRLVGLPLHLPSLTTGGGGVLTTHLASQVGIRRIINRQRVGRVHGVGC
jgi:hypothetical protein